MMSRQRSFSFAETVVFLDIFASFLIGEEKPFKQNVGIISGPTCLVSSYDSCQLFSYLYAGWNV